jgi:hypothetical protein
VLLTKYYSGDQTKKNKIDRISSKYGGKARCIQGLVGKPEGRRQLGRPTCSLKDNIKMDPQEVRWGPQTGLNWIRIKTSGNLLQLW